MFQIDWCETVTCVINDSLFPESLAIFVSEPYKFPWLKFRRTLQIHFVPVWVPFQSAVKCDEGEITQRWV